MFSGETPGPASCAVSENGPVQAHLGSQQPRGGAACGEMCAMLAWSFGYSYRRVGVQFVGNGHWGLGAGRAGIGDRTPVKAGACDSVSEGPRAARRIRDIIDIP